MTAQSFKKPAQKSINDNVKNLLGKYIRNSSPLTNNGDGGMFYTFNKNKSRILTLKIIKQKGVDTFSMEIIGTHKNGKSNTVSHDSLILGKVVDNLVQIRNELNAEDSKIMESITDGIVEHESIVEFQKWFNSTAKIVK